MNHVRGSRIIAKVCLIGLILNNGALLAINPVLHVQQGPISSAELGDQLMSSYSMVSEKQLSDEEREEQSKKPVLDIQPLSKQEQRKIVWNLCGARERKHQVPVDEYQQKIFDAHRSLLGDGEVFFSRDPKDHSQHVFSKINYTETVAGEVMLARKLARPTSVLADLRSNQAFVIELVNNEALYNECRKLVRSFKKIESDFCSLWIRDNKATQDLVDTLYPTTDKHWLKAANKSPALLEAYTRLGNMGTIWNTTGDIFIGAALSMVSVRAARAMGLFTVERELTYGEVLGRQVSGMLPFKYWNAYSELNQNGPAKVDIGGGDYVLSPVGQNAAHDYLRSILKPAKLASIPLTCVVLWQKYSNVKAVLELANQTRKTALLIQKRLMGAARAVNVLAGIDRLAFANAAMRKGMASGPTIKRVLNGSLAKSQDFKELIAQLQTNTFKGQPSFFSYTGRVLAAYKNLQTSKDNFADVVEAIGELDAYLSIATLYKKFAHERVNYCFVDYQEGSKPYLAMQDFWNPQVDPSVVVTNSLELGVEGNVRNIILTGSNTAGKSTLLKAIMLEALMAQTFGIASAKKMVMTPFTYLGSSMNIIDNTAQGTSLYQAEVDRAVMLINAVRDVQDRGGCALLLMDELFRGTGAAKADEETYTCAKELYNLDSVMYILATHYPTNPTKLEAETHGICKNYKVDAYIDANGKIVRPFKIEPGISTSNIAADILQAGLHRN